MKLRKGGEGKMKRQVILQSKKMVQRGIFSSAVGMVTQKKEEKIICIVFQNKNVN